jgi:hypothetical protein
MGGHIYHDGVVIEWQQSGEVIRGKRNIELRGELIQDARG